MLDTPLACTVASQPAAAAAPPTAARRACLVVRARVRHGRTSLTALPAASLEKLEPRIAGMDSRSMRSSEERREKGQRIDGLGGRKRCFWGTRSASLSCSVREAPRGGQRAMGAHCARRQAMRRQSLHLRRAGLLFRGAERNSQSRSALLYKLCFATRAGDIFVALSALAHNLASKLRWALKLSNSSRAVDPAATTGADRPSLRPLQSWATQSTKASKGCAAALLGARKN